MRLIDADMLKKYLLDNGKETERFLQYVDEQPTAYDTHKVVEQIKSIKEKEYVACTDEDCGYCEYLKDCWNGEMSDKLALDKAIEIAKGGGIE